MKAVIMAGGKGTRLRPLTCHTPKPMVPLLDRPVMEYTIELLKKHGITDIAVTVQYLPQIIRDHFGDGSEYGVNLRYFEEDCPLGTAGSVKNAEAFLDDTFLVISGDGLTDFDLTEAIRYHNHKGAMATIVLTHVNNPLEYGVVMTNDNGEIIRFLEKPSWGEVFSDAVNTGIYIFDSSVLSYLREGEESDFSKDLFPMLMQHGQPVYGYSASGYWSDIGNLEQYRQTQYDMLSGAVQVTIRGNEVFPQVWIGEQAKLDRNVHIEAPAFIGNHCIIEDHVRVGPYTVIGEGSLVKSGAKLERAVLWKHAVMDKQAEVSGGTACRSTVVGCGASVLEGAVIGDGVQIGKKSVIHSGAMIWPGKVVESYSQVNQSILWGEGQKKSLFGHQGVTGTSYSGLSLPLVNRLAMAYGSLMKPGSRVIVSRDASPYAELIAAAMTSGLHASGVNTFDIGPVISSVARYGVFHLDCPAGIYVSKSAHDSDEQYTIEFYDASGLPIPKGMERKIENAFIQQDCRRLNTEQVGSGEPVHGMAYRYRDHLLQLADKERIQAQALTVVIASEERGLLGMIPEVLEALGSKVIQMYGRTTGVQEIKHMIEYCNADFGVLLDKDGQLLQLIAEQGQVIDEEMKSVLQVLIRLEMGEGDLHVPVQVSGIADQIGQWADRPVVRTKADRRSVMESCQKEGFSLVTDGICFITHLMELMARKEAGLTELFRAIPSFAVLRNKVFCPWEDKGKVMRYLMEDTKGESVELIDGIKVFHGEGWALILPDSEAPEVHIVSQALTLQEAERLMRLYVHKIEDCRSKTAG